MNPGSNDFINNLLSQGVLVGAGLIAASIGFIIYIIYSYSLMRVLGKVREDSIWYKIMAWIPLLNIISLSKAAGYELIWGIVFLVLLLIPLINGLSALVVFPLLFYKLAERLGYDDKMKILWAILGLPILGSISLVILAFIRTPSEG